MTSTDETGRPVISPGPPPWVKRKRKYWPAWAIIALVLGTLLMCGSCGLIAAALSDGDQDGPSGLSSPSLVVDTTGAPATTEAKTAPARPTYKPGITVRAGDFQYTIHSSKCGIAEVGSEYLEHKAQGSFCRLDVTVKNMIQSPRYFHTENSVSAQDEAGRRFSADGEAGVYGNADSGGFLDEINPGNKVRAFVFFDLPEGAKLASVTFDAGTFTTAEDATVLF